MCNATEMSFNLKKVYKMELVVYITQGLNYFMKFSLSVGWMPGDCKQITVQMWSLNTTVSLLGKLVQSDHYDAD
jgi:hypothetical protein